MTELTLCATCGTEYAPNVDRRAWLTEAVARIGLDGQGKERSRQGSRQGSRGRVIDPSRRAGALRPHRGLRIRNTLCVGQCQANSAAGGGHERESESATGAGQVQEPCSVCTCRGCVIRSSHAME